MYFKLVIARLTVLLLSTVRFCQCYVVSEKMASKKSCDIQLTSSEFLRLIEEARQSDPQDFVDMELDFFGQATPSAEELLRMGKFII